MAEATGRMAEELRLLRERYPDAQYQAGGFWFLIPDFPMPSGWGRDRIDLAFQLSDTFPETLPYGFYVPSGLRFNGATPTNFTDPAPGVPLLGTGPWAFFSGNPDDWTPKATVSEGSNVLSWVHSIGERLREGA